MKLETKLTEVTRILPAQAKALKHLHIETVADLLYHFPARYGDTASKMNIGSLGKGDTAVIFGKISGLKTSKAFRKKIPMAEGVIEDETGKMKIIWFHQAYLAKMIGGGSLVRAEGKVSERRGELYMSNPKIETVTKIPLAVGDSLWNEGGPDHTLYPVYPESRGITSNWMYHTVQRIFSSGILDNIEDPIPKDILETYKLPNLKTSLIWIHTPRKTDDALSARKRFAFEEIFFIQLEKQQNRARWQREKGFAIEPNPETLASFINRLPYPLTGAQNKTLDHVLSDFKKGHPMSRLLEGDVGSGKTAVAAASCFVVTTTHPKGQDFGNLQTAYMVPTEILAQQHFESFIKFFVGTGISIGLITGSGCKKFPSKVNPEGYTSIYRAQLLKWVAGGEIPILIGTHALIQKSVKFKHLAYVIIDEQHRFGTSQRQKLAQKEGITPHLLSMTATPIPRTLALTLYGDLDLSLLDEMPPGRKKIITEIVLPGQRKATYEKVRGEIKAGRQAYVICPRINEPDPTKEGAILAKSVTEEAKRLKKDVFQEFEIAVLHGKMTPAEKEKVMNNFNSGAIDILVATSVVEVGVNVPNATVIIIEGGERFGLAQLHQLRGRVQRSNHQPYCFVFTESSGEKTADRLRALQKAANGFELAEFDLQQRGAGQLAGGKQWGISDLAMEAIRNIKMVEAARLESAKIISEDPTLSRFPLLADHLSHTENKIHFE
jgi:ATP-dependent DNA helicase RecG